MRKAIGIAIFLAFSVGVSYAQSAATTAAHKEFSRDFWRDRTKQLLKDNFPRHRSLVEHLIVDIEMNEEPYALSDYCRTDGCTKSPTITVNKGFIEGLIRSPWGEDGYLAVLDHEMAHIILKNPFWRRGTMAGRSPEEDVDMYNANEHEADWLAMEFLRQQGRKPCALLGLFSVSDKEMHWSKKDSALAPINLHRWRVVQRICAVRVGRDQDTSQK